MTIDTLTRETDPFVGNGANTSFAFDFKVFAASDLQVVKTDATGANTTLVLNSDYSVSLNADQNNDPGGTVTFPITGSPLSAAERLTVASAIPATQNTDITNAGAFLPQVIEDAFDKLTALVQQNLDAMARSIIAPVSDPAGTSYQLPTVANRAGKLVGWDSNGNLIPVSSTSGTATQLALDLAANSGAGLVGYNDANTYGAGTVGKRLNDLFSSIGSSLVGFIQAGTGAVATTLQERGRRHIDIWDWPVIGNGIADDTTPLTNAINQANALGVPLYCSKPGTFRTNSTLPTFSNSPGLLTDLPAGSVVFHHYATTSCLVARGSYKKMRGFTVINKSAPGSGTSGAACVQVINCAYGDFKDVYTAHDLDAYHGFLLEQQYDGSAYDANFIAHLGCWYNKIDGVHALYATLGETRGFGVSLSVNANARGVVNPPGEAPGTYTGSAKHNVIDNSNIEARSQGMRFDLANNNTVRGGQFLGCTNQVRLSDSQQNVFFATRHNQWLTNPALSTGTSARNVFIYPSLFNVTAPPWTMGSLASTDAVLHFGDGTTEAWKTFSQIDLQAGQVKFPATQNPSVDANTLDDYEEGQWVPTLTFGGAAAGMTFSQRGGTYIKVGRLVVVSFDIRLSAKGSSTGAAAIGALPFASSGAAGDGYGCADLRLYSGMTGTGRIGNGYSFGGTTISELCDHSINLTDANFTNTSIVFGSMTYVAAV